MDRQEYREFLEAIKEGYEEGDYELVATYADQVDLGKIKEAKILEIIASSYARIGEYANAIDALLKAKSRNSTSKSIVYKLCELSIRAGDLDSAVKYYEEFCRLASKSSRRYILKYEIGRAGRVPVNELIKVLETYNARENDDKWAYELAKLYHEAGEAEKCVETCDHICVWYSDGEYVKKALELKFAHTALTPDQQRRYEDIMREYLEPEERMPVQEEPENDEVAMQLAAEYLGEGEAVPEEPVVEREDNTDYSSLIAGIAAQTEMNASKEVVKKPEKAIADEIQDTRVISVKSILSQIENEEVHPGVYEEKEEPEIPEIILKEPEDEEEPAEEQAGQTVYESGHFASEEAAKEPEVPEISEEVTESEPMSEEEEEEEEIPQEPEDITDKVAKASTITMDELRAMIHAGNKNKAQTGVFFTYEEPTEEDIAQEAALKAEREERRRKAEEAAREAAQERRRAREAAVRAEEEARAAAEAKRLAEEEAERAAAEEKRLAEEAERKAAQEAADAAIAEEEVILAASAAKIAAMDEAEQKESGDSEENEYEDLSMLVHEFSQDEKIFEGGNSEPTICFADIVNAIKAENEKEYNSEEKSEAENAEITGIEETEEGTVITEEVIEEPTEEAEEKAESYEAEPFEESAVTSEEAIFEPTEEAEEKAETYKAEPFEESAVTSEEAIFEPTEEAAEKAETYEAEKAYEAEPQEEVSAAFEDGGKKDIYMFAAAAGPLQKAAEETEPAAPKQEVSDFAELIDEASEEFDYEGGTEGSKAVTEEEIMDSLIPDVTPDPDQEVEETRFISRDEILFRLNAAEAIAAASMAEGTSDSDDDFDMDDDITSEAMAELIAAEVGYDDEDEKAQTPEADEKVTQETEKAPEAEKEPEAAETIIQQQEAETETLSENDDISATQIFSREDMLAAAEEEIDESMLTPEERLSAAIQRILKNSEETINRDVEQTKSIHLVIPSSAAAKLGTPSVRLSQYASSVEKPELVSEAADITPEDTTDSAPRIIDNVDFSYIPISRDEDGQLGLNIELLAMSSEDDYEVEGQITFEEMLNNLENKVEHNKPKVYDVEAERLRKIQQAVGLTTPVQLPYSMEDLSFEGIELTNIDGTEEEKQGDVFVFDPESIGIIPGDDFEEEATETSEEAENADDTNAPEETAGNDDIVFEETAIESAEGEDAEAEEAPEESAEGEDTESEEASEENAEDEDAESEEASEESAEGEDTESEEAAEENADADAEAIPEKESETDEAMLAIAAFEAAQAEMNKEAAESEEMAAGEEMACDEDAAAQQDSEAFEEAAAEESEDEAAKADDILNEGSEADKESADSESEMTIDEELAQKDESEMSEAEKAIAAFEMNPVSESEDAEEPDEEFDDIFAALEGPGEEKTDISEEVLEADAFEDMFGEFEKAVESDDDYAEYDNEETVEDEPAAVLENASDSGYQIPAEVRESMAEFLLIEGMEKQINNAIGNIIEKKLAGTENGGNLIVTGDIKSGKTFLAIESIKAVAAELGSGNGKVAKVQAELLNGKNIEKVFEKIAGSDLIIENVGLLDDDTVTALQKVMESNKYSSMVIIEGNQLAVESLFASFPDFASLFENRINISELSIVQWADVAIKYADEKGFELDDLAKLALHARINGINKPTTRLGYDNITRIMDEAIAKAEKRYSGRLFAAFKKDSNVKRDLLEADFM